MSDRIDQHDQTGQIAAETGNRQVTAFDPPGGKPQNGEQTDHFNDAHDRVLKRHEAVGALARLTVLSDFLLEAILQPGLRRERPHQRQALDRFSQQTGQLTDLLLAAFSGTHHLSAEQADQPDDHRRQQKNGEGQLPVQPEHGAQHHQQLKDAGNGVVNRLVEHLTDAVGILGEAIGQITG